MADRLVSVDSESLRFPDSVAGRLASDAEDRATPLGGAVDRVARRAPFEPAGLSEGTRAGLEPAGLSEATQAQLSATYAPIPRPSTLPAETALANSFDTATSSYNVTPANLARAHAAASKARSGMGRFDICCIGTSLTAGTGAVTKSQSWPSRLAAELEQDGIPSGGSGFIAGQSNNSATTDPRVTITSGWTPFNQTASTLMQGGTVGNPITFTDTSPSTRVDIYTIDYPMAFTYAIDGGSPVQVTYSTSTGTNKVITVEGLASANHTVVITPTSIAGGVTYIMGVAFRNSSGVAVHNLGIGGITAGSALVAAPYWHVFPVALQLAPTLTFIEIGSNELSPLAGTFAGTLNSGITRLLAAGSDVVLVGPPPTGASTRPIAAVLAVDYAQADVADVPLVDLSDRLVSWSQVSAYGLGYAADGLTVHFNQAGYAEFARTMANALRL